MSNLINVKTVSDLVGVAEKLLSFSGEKKVFAFHGEMGVGKTTFIKAICEQLGVEGDTSSPTFAIVNEYDGGNDKIFHLDLYRLKDEAEVFDIGLEDYVNGQYYCFIEWPNKAGFLLPKDIVNVYIELQNDNSRLIRF